MKDTWSIIFIASLILILGIIFYTIFRPKVTNEIIQESFSNALLENNLISNGSFDNGQHPKQYAGHSGRNDIIVHPNSGQTSYVLRQGYSKRHDKDVEVYYKIELDLKPNTLYLLGCLYFSTKGNQLIHKIQFDGGKRQTLKTLDDPASNSNSDFKYKYTMFRTPNEGKKVHTEIFMSFQFNDVEGYNYITDIGIFEILDNNNIPVTEDLRTYFNCYNHESVKTNRALIKDLSKNGLDFKASNPGNVQVGNINLMNNIITGPSAFKLQNHGMLSLVNNFTFLLFVKGSSIAQNIVENFDGEDDEEVPIIVPKDGNKIIHIPGNQGTAISIILPKRYGKIYVIAGGVTYETPISYMPNFDSLIALSYNGERIILYMNGEVIFETMCPKLYFDNQPLVINPDGTFMGQLFAFAFYNKELKAQQIMNVSRYFMKMMVMGKELATVSVNMIENVASFLTAEPKRKHRPSKSDDNGEEKPCDENCPKVIFENGHYFVIVPNGSKLAEEIGYSGIRDYGTNIETARLIFETNFPKCGLPEVLDKRKFRPNMEQCPFILLNEENPCRKWDCRNVNWREGTVKDENCKKAIDTYCSKHSDTDQACFCWKKENRNNPECLKWRGRFETADKCDFRKHKIENHPDADKWIRKDKIPCWGCNLTDPGSSKDMGRKGSGAR